LSYTPAAVGQDGSMREHLKFHLDPAGGVAIDGAG